MLLCDHLLLVPLSESTRTDPRVPGKVASVCLGRTGGVSAVPFTPYP